MEKKLYGADVVIDSLRKHGINLVFGIPGAKIDRLFEGLDGQDSEGAPKLIVTRHEQNAAFMAQAYGRLTGKTGVAITTSGPGVGNLATGIMTANAEGDPMLAIGGQVQRKDLHRADEAQVFVEGESQRTLGDAHLGQILVHFLLHGS